MGRDVPPPPVGALARAVFKIEVSPRSRLGVKALGLRAPIRTTEPSTWASERRTHALQLAAFDSSTGTELYNGTGSSRSSKAGLLTPSI